MAESYRGLTIRIGGDTTKLEQALKAINQASSSTSASLRAVSQALKMDPGNMDTLNLQLGYVSQRSEEAAYKLHTMKDAYDQIAATDIDGTPLSELAAETENAALRAAMAREEYYKLEEALATEYRVVSDLVRLQAENTNIQFAKDADSASTIEDLVKLRNTLDGLPDAIRPSEEAFSSLDEKIMGFAERANAVEEKLSERIKKYNDDTAALNEKTNQQLEELVNREQDLLRQRAEAIEDAKSEGMLTTSFLKEIESEFDTQIAKIRESIDSIDDSAERLEIDKTFEKEMAEARAAADKELKKLEEDIKKAFAAAAKVKPETFNFKNANVDLESVVNALRELPDDIRPSEEEIEAFKNRVAALKTQFTAAFEEVKTAKLIEQLDRMGADLARDDAQLNKIIDDFVRLSQTPQFDMKTNAALNEIKQLDAAIEAASKRYEAMAKASKLDPNNPARMKAAQDALNEVLTLGNQRAELFAKTVGAIDASRVERMRDVFGSVGNGVVQTTNQMREVAKRIAEIGAEAAAFATKNSLGSEWADAFKNVGEDLDVLPPKMAKLRDELKVLKEALADMGKDIDAASIYNALEKVGETARVPGDELVDSLKRANETTKESEAAFQLVFDRIAQYAERAGRAIVESANTIDAAYRDMRKTVNGTEEDFAALLDAATKFSQTNAVSTDTILSMEALGGQLGVTVDRLQEFGEVTSSLEIATDMTAEQIALKLGQITNVMSDLDFNTFDNFADALVRLGNNTATTESQIMEVAQRMAAVANVTSMTTPQLLGWSAAIASTGMHSESAATSITRTITGIGQAVSEGGTKLEQFAKIAGMTSDEFKSAWESSSSEALEAFVKGLETLSDDSTAAIEALDAVGISSVRQETSLLALSQTISNLDKSVAMSQDAFDGVSDEWGDAGDAANEAGKKSEGFSGQLKILQNNAANLAASLGDGLVPIMGTVSQALSVVTDFLGALPEPVKEAVVGVGGMTVAVSALTATLGPIVDKLKDAHVSLGSLMDVILPSSGIIDTTTGSIVRAGVAGEGAAAGVTAFSLALKSIGVVAALTVILAGISAIKDELDHARENAENFEKATKGIASAMDEANKSYDAYLGNADKAADSVKSLGERIEETTKAQAELADKMSEDWGAIGVDEAKLDLYIDKIAQLGNQGVSTKENMEQLRNAVSQANSMMGSSIEIIDEQTGALSLTAEQIRDVAEAHKERIRQEQAKTNYNEELDLNRRLHELLEEAVKKSDEAIQNHAKTVQYAGGGMLQYGGSVTGFGESISDADAEVKRLTEEVKKSDETLKELESTSGKAEHVFESIGAAMAYAGTDTSEYAQLTDKEMKKVEKAFEEGGKTVSALTKALELVGIAATNAADSMSKASAEEIESLKRVQETAYTEAKRAGEDRLTDLKTQLDAEYDARKRALDADYDLQKQAFDREADEQKRALDAEYQNLKQALDREYDERKRQLDREYSDAKDGFDKMSNERKKALDSEYEELKSQLDKMSNERKKALDKELDALKSGLDKNYNEQKKALDKSYDERKKALDKELDALKDANDDEEDALKKHLDELYNARKKAYDKEYKQYQKENDKILKELKKKQSKEIDEFKDATSKYIKELKKRYKKIKEETEKNDGRKEIDSEIERLKALTEAERDAIEDRERAEKTAELKKNVEQAKTRKTRQEAEKALADYVAETEQKLRERSREAEIKDLENKKDRIKEETEAKKDALDEELDNEIEAYNKRRDQELEDLKNLHDKEYELEQDRLDNLEALRKEKLDKKLADYRAELDAELKALNKQNEDEEDALAEKHNGMLETLKENNESQLALLKESQQARIDAAKEANDLELEGVKAQHQAILNARKEANDTELSDLKAYNDTQLEEIKLANELELENLKTANQAVLDEKKLANDLAIEDLKLYHQNALNEMKIAHELELEQVKLDNDAKITEMRRANEDELTELKNKQEDELTLFKTGADALTEEANTKKDTLKAASEEAAGSLVTNATSAKDILKQLLEDGKISLQDYLGAMEGMPPAMKTVFDNAGINTKEGLDAIAKQMLDDGTISRDQYNGVMKGIPDDLNAIYTLAGLETANQMGLLEKELGQGGEKGRSAFIGPIKKLETEAPDSASKTRKSLADTLANTSGTQLAGDSHRGAFKGEIDKMKGDAETAASLAIQGLANRLDYGKTDVGDKSKGLAETLKDKFDESMDSHSPSREMERRGEYVVEGLVNGMDSKESDVENTTVRLADVVKNRFDEIETRGYGENAGGEFESGLASTEYAIQNTADNLARSASDPLDGVQNWTENSGYNAGINFNNGLASAASWIYDTAMSIADSVASILHHSTPDEGPLKHDDEWGSDLVQNIIDGMRDRESDLLRQTRRMAEIVERGFDPEMTVDAAYEAIDTIRRGNMRDIASAQSMNTNNNQVVNVNVTLSDVTIREDADIRRLAEEIASMMRRKEAAMIGW